MDTRPDSRGAVPASLATPPVASGVSRRAGGGAPREIAGRSPAAFLSLLAVVAALSTGACTNSESGLRFLNQLPVDVPRAELGPKTAAPTFDGGATTFLQDNVLITFRQLRTNGFQTTTLTWNGSIKNLGSVVRNARFEILTTRGPDLRLTPQTQIEATQRFGDLLAGQEQQLRLEFTFPNSHALAISTRFAHD